MKTILTTALTVLTVYTSFIMDQKSVRLLIIIRLFFEFVLCFKAIKKPNQFRDYVISWSFTSFIIILFSFEFLVVTKLKILFIENLILMLMLCCSIFFLMLSSDHQISSRRTSDPILIDYLYNNTLKTSSIKKNQLSNLNFVVSLFFASASLIYTTNLILTSICYPKYYFFKLILLPYDCSFVYPDKL